MDLQIIDNGNGVDVCFNGRDLVVIDGFQNMPYLGMFGGNVKQSTKQFSEGEERFDFWGNSLLMVQNETIQFNSNFERLLFEMALTSSTILVAEETIKTDLKFMSNFSDFTVETSIIAVDKLKIFINFNKPNNLDSKDFVYIWDATKKELTKED